MSSADDAAEEPTAEPTEDTSVPSDEPVVELEDVEVHFTETTAIQEATPKRIRDWLDWNPKPTRAVDGVDLEIGEKEIIAIIGESGSGKTTLGKTAIGLQRPTGGTVRYRGYDLWELEEQNVIDDMTYEQARKALQIVHQDPGAALHPYKTVMSGLMEPLKIWYPELSRADYRERILGMFQACGLTPVEEYEDRYPHELSGGEQQRMTLIRAMLMEPELILMDEPVSALDQSLSIELMELMLELQDVFDTSYLFISHTLEHARYITSQAGGKVAVMYLGNVVEFGDIDEVLTDPEHPYTQVMKWATMPMNPRDARHLLEAQTPVRKFESPDPDNPPSGCHFHPRCPKAKEICAQEYPDPEELGDEDDHVACFRVEEDHPYWNDEWLDPDGEIEIPD